MSFASLMHDCRRGRLEIPRAGVVRQTVELMVLLCLCVLLVRTFSAEAYVVPTGSMAPDALGAASRARRALTAASCSWSGSTRKDRPAGRSARIAASAAWMTRRRSSAAATACWCRSSCTISGGPSAGRWPCSISRASPARPMSSAWSGLPGESIRIIGGDIFVDGQIVRKSLPEIRAMRILVHDSRFQPQDADRFPRWQFRSGSRDPSARERLDDRRRPVRPQGRQRRRSAAHRLARLQALGPGQRTLRTGPRFLRLQRRRSPSRQRGRRPGDGGTLERQRGRRCDLGGASVGLRSVSS